jgi:putative spermidine/putrescine transport system substrate-binding protein
MMKRCLFALAALAAVLWTGSAGAADKLVVSIWGGSWNDLVEQTAAKKFTAQTGAQVEFITGGTIDRLNKAKLAKGSPESDVTFTTSHIGTWAYVYTIVYRPDLVPAGIKFDTWADLWKPELKGKLSAPDFDTSHLVAVAAKLEGGDPVSWEKGQAKLKALKPNFKSYYANDAASQQLMQTGEAPVQVMLSMNAYYIASQGIKLNVAIPKEGAVLGIDTIGIMKGTKNAELAYKFINILLDPAVQAEIANLKKGSPVVSNAKLDPEVAKLPGVFTTPDQWSKEAMIIDHKLRAEKTGEWRKWFTENVIN